MTPESVHIIIPSPKIGGMEKRFGGLFVHLAARGDDVVLVAPDELIERLAATAECRAINQFRSRIA